MRKGRRRRIPAEVLERARSATAPGSDEAPPAPPPEDERAASEPGNSAPRKKILAVLRRLHPMD